MNKSLLLCFFYYFYFQKIKILPPNKLYQRSNKKKNNHKIAHQFLQPSFQKYNIFIKFLMPYFWVIIISKVITTPAIPGTMLSTLLLSIPEDSYHKDMRKVLRIYQEYVFCLISLPFN